MRGRALLAFGALGLVLIPSVAEPCSCRRPSGDLHEQLLLEKRESHYVYLGQVLDVGPPAGAENWQNELATVVVRESYKGALDAGTRLVLGANGGGDCSMDLKQGDLLLAYAGERPERVGYCSRSRVVTSAHDVELRWLRGGTLPPMPTAARGEIVECSPCDTYSVTQALVGLPAGDSCNGSLWMKDVPEALATSRPFWTWIHDESPPANVAIGVDLKGRAFRLTDASNGQDEACRHRILMERCVAVELVRSEGDNHELKCVGPSSAEVVCDENMSRKARWGRVVSTEGLDCEWREPARPTCSRSGGPDAGNRPPPDAVHLLSCRPVEWTKSHLNCEVGLIDGGRLE